MPRRDKTGPNGNGPNTGRGLGPCSKQIVKDKRGRGLGLRLGGGWRYRGNSDKNPL